MSLPLGVASEGQGRFVQEQVAFVSERPALCQAHRAAGLDVLGFAILPLRSSHLPVLGTAETACDKDVWFSPAFNFFSAHVGYRVVEKVADLAAIMPCIGRICHPSAYHPREYTSRPDRT
ncbi:g6890 [Coccomyxa viridis]|uniref:G6890 protein n=1 Tax=Coccomyxa viridis TaxID=1274662 RepID=A0ABP1FWH4_9CHLO